MCNLIFNIISKRNGQKYVDSIYEITEDSNYSSQDYIEKRVNNHFSSSKYVETYRYEDWVQWSNEDDWKCVINTTDEDLKYIKREVNMDDCLDSIFS